MTQAILAVPTNLCGSDFAEKSWPGVILNTEPSLRSRQSKGRPSKQHVQSPLLCRNCAKNAYVVREYVMYPMPVMPPTLPRLMKSELPHHHPPFHTYTVERVLHLRKLYRS